MTRMNAAYRDLVVNHPAKWCWNCGRDHWQRPKDWFGPWMMQRAHLGSGSGVMVRKLLVQCVNILCPLCHDLHCNMEQRTIGGVTYPCISNANMLWLKQEMDPFHWDPEVVSRYWIGIPPDPVPPVAFWGQQYRDRRGVR
jgi:hypothetical protein